MDTTSRIGRRRLLHTTGAASLTASIAPLRPARAAPDADAQPAAAPPGDAGSGGRSGDRMIAELGVAQAVAAIRNGELKAEDYVGALLRRAETLKALNACISVNTDEALQAARAVDQARASGQPLPPLAGLPLLVKDNINYAGHPTTAGTWALREFRPTDTAPVLQILLAKGALVLAKTNMHELALGTTSSNAGFGFAKNPYDISRVAGGSSGGSAAALAARIGPAALGSDTGGSLRIPSSFCGGTALRPSVGNGGAERRYPSGGIAPISHTRDTVGPMARTMADVALLDAAIVGSAPAGPTALRGVVLALPRRYFWENLDDEVARICTAAVERLRDVGVRFIEADLDGVPEANALAAFPIALYEIGEDFPRYLAASGSNLSWADVQGQVKSPDVQGDLTAAQGVTREIYERAMQVYRPRLQQLYAEYFRRLGVDGVICPTVPVPAPLIDPSFSGAIAINGHPQPGGPAAEFAVTIRNTDANSVAGIPSIAFPAGITRSGLPVGLELDGPLGSDQRLLSIGLAVEAVLGSVPPPPNI